MAGMKQQTAGPPASLRIGTSGWVYKHWLGIFYPARMPGDEQLPFYAERYDTVEINYSFYQLPERKVFERWRVQTPAEFLFAVKASRYLTHMKKLKDPEEPLQRLMERAAGLDEKLGPILFQFPGQWRVNLGRFDHFLDALRGYPGHRYAFEFRHASWLVPEVYAMVEKAGGALCLPVHPKMPLDIRLTAPWTYIRMHSGQFATGYTEEELAVWAGRVQAFLHAGNDVYIYFNNDPEGWALRNADRLRAMLTQAIVEQR
jgi:uncharacterized protein YecE (DUF72 family)